MRTDTDTQSTKKQGTMCVIEAVWIKQSNASRHLNRLKIAGIMI